MAKKRKLREAAEEHYCDDRRWTCSTRSLPVYDIKFAKVPILSKHGSFENKANAAAPWIGFLDFVSVASQQSRNLLSTLEYPRFPSTSITIPVHLLTNSDYLPQAQTIGLTVFGVVLRITVPPRTCAVFFLAVASGHRPPDLATVGVSLSSTCAVY